MSSVYIIEGNTGDWDDERSWYVTAYLDKSLAATHAQLANERAAELHAKHYAVMPEEGYAHSTANITSPFDPEIEMASTGTRYYVREVALSDALPISATWPKP